MHRRRVEGVVLDGDFQGGLDVSMGVLLLQAQNGPRRWDTTRTLQTLRLTSQAGVEVASHVAIGRQKALFQRGEGPLSHSPL